MKNNNYSSVSAALIAAISVPAFAQESQSESSSVTTDRESSHYLHQAPPDTQAARTIETLVVTADFRAAALDQVPASISVLDRAQLEDDGGENFQDVLNGIANLNWSGGSSRARYFQIRGVGDQEEYEGAPNASVGFFIDDIDLSGLGMASGLFDIDQVEVLRGPQSTLFGGNALAGAIYLKSAEPTAATEAGVELSGGSDDLLTIGAYAGGALSRDGDILGRMSLQSHQQNGYMDNAYLGRSDTNARDELSAKAKLRWYATDTLQADLTLLQGHFDNGYDAWSLDSNGSTTYTDRPGVDTQRTTGAGLKLTWQAHRAFSLESITSYADTKQRHAYDGDWANPAYWQQFECYGAPCVYDYWWDKTAKRQNFSQDIRLLSTDEGRIFSDTTDWLVGLYVNQLDESNQLLVEERYEAGPLYTSHRDSDYRAKKLSGFAQLDTYLGDWHYSVGLRLEHWDADYRDSDNEAFNPAETMWGGHLSLSYTLAKGQLLYAKVARGYKPGGFNTDLPAELSQYRSFDAETLYNYELGHSGAWWDGMLVTRLSLFFMDRQDQQVDASVQIPDSGNFILYTANATSSTNYGLEAQSQYFVTDNLTLSAILGLLNAKYDTYIYQDDNGQPVDLSGRELAHAPSYNYQLAATWRADSGLFAHASLSGMDSFYYSDSNDFVSDNYQLLNLRLGYEAEHWALFLWGRNLTDESYGVRGFYFGNEPNKDWAAQQYIRYGDPRQLGVTFRYDYW